MTNTRGQPKNSVKYANQTRECDDDVIIAHARWHARTNACAPARAGDDDVIRRAHARLMTSSKMAAPIKHVRACAHGRRHLDDVIAGSANHSRPSDDVIAAILEHVTALGQSRDGSRLISHFTRPMDWVIDTTLICRGRS